MIALMTATQLFNLPTGLLSGVCYVESKHTVQAVHKDDGGSASIGLCQIKYNTAKGMGYRGTEHELQVNPTLNALYAGRYLHWQLLRYHNDYRKAIAAYNSGTVRFKDGKIRNQKYVDKVMKAWKENR